MGETGEDSDGKRLCTGQWAHDAVCRCCLIESYTWNLCGFVNQCHHTKFSLKGRDKIHDGFEAREKSFYMHYISISI